MLTSVDMSAAQCGFDITSADNVNINELHSNIIRLQVDTPVFHNTAGSGHTPSIYASVLGLESSSSVSPTSRILTEELPRILRLCCAASSDVMALTGTGTQSSIGHRRELDRLYCSHLECPSPHFLFPTPVFLIRAASLHILCCESI